MNQSKKSLRLKKEEAKLGRTIKLVKPTAVSSKTTIQGVKKLAEKLAGINASGVFYLNLIDKKRDGDFSFHFIDTNCQLSTKAAVNPNFQIDTTAKTWNEIASGKLNPIMAYYKGKIDVSGDINLAKKLLVKTRIQKSETFNF